MKRITLIEAMVVIAALGLLGSVASATYERAADREPPQNAAQDLVAQLNRARSRAAETKSDVWLVVYPAYSHRANALIAGRGGYFVIENAAGDFNADAGAAPNIYYRAEVGTPFDPVAKVVEGPNVKLLDSFFLEDYGGKIRLRLPSGRLELPGLEVTTACTFCTGGRGAIGFSPDGAARFVDGTGDLRTGPQAVTFRSDRTRKTSAVTISPDGKVVTAIKL